MPFQKGQSGNPKGRPRKIPAWVGKFRALEPDMLALLHEILTGKDAKGKAVLYEESTKMRALELAFAYSRGKPRQQVELTGEGGGPIQHQHGVLAAPPAMTTEQWQAGVDAQRAAIEAATAAALAESEVEK